MVKVLEVYVIGLFFDLLECDIIVFNLYLEVLIVNFNGLWGL